MAAAVPARRVDTHRHARRVDAPRRRRSARQAAAPHQSSASRRPELRLLPRPRAAANALIVLLVLIGALMLAAVALHTRLAERQLEIDRMEQEVDEASQRFDVLRQQRAELRSPQRLALEAGKLGMLPSAHTEFLTVDGTQLATVLVAAGHVEEHRSDVSAEDPLEQIQRVRQAEEG